MTLEEFESYGALVGAADWDDVDQRVQQARAAVSWLLESHRSLRACDVFGERPTIPGGLPCKPRVWPPSSFCGLDQPLNHVEELVSLHEANGGSLVTCGHKKWNACAGRPAPTASVGD